MSLLQHKTTPISVNRNIKEPSGSLELQDVSSAMSSLGADRQHNFTALIASISNFSIQYNLGAIAPALKLMDDTANDDPNYTPPFPRSTAQMSALSSLSFVGAILGQLLIGYAGDYVGRRNAMIFTNCLVVIGALGGALFVWGDADTVYGLLMLSRIVTGLGIGGNWPLGAIMRKEQTRKGSSFQVALAYFWQNPGVMAPYVVAIIVLACYGRDNADYDTVSAEFRWILGVGAIPSVTILILCFFEADSKEYMDKKKELRDTHASNPFTGAIRNPQYLWTLVGTGGGWFLYDIAVFGMLLNQPQMIDTVFGKDTGPWENCVNNIYVGLIGCAGCLLGVWNVKHMGVKRLQNWGFFAMMCSYIIFAISTIIAPDNTHLGLTNLLVISFFLQWGVNVTTYTIPSQSFPVEVRATFYGCSAAMGKFGAVIGSASFGPLAKVGAETDRRGLIWILAISAVLSFLGMLTTVYFVEPFGKANFLCRRTTTTEDANIKGKYEDDETIMEQSLSSDI